MTCNREFEMSQCLDGRLAMTQRSALLDHVVRCRACGDLWQQMNQAQGLVRSLQAWPVGKEFRAQLWQRIQAGEAVPRAATVDTVPLRTKMRYFGTGAAAAGLLILAGGYWFDGDRGTQRPAAPAPNNMPSIAGWGNTFAPLMPTSAFGASAVGAMSSLAVGGLVQNVRQLQRRLTDGSLATRQQAVAGSGPNAELTAMRTRAAASHHVDQIEQELERAKAFATCLLRLHEQGLLEMSAADLATVEQAHAVLGGCMRSASAVDLRQLSAELQPLRSLNVDQLRCSVKVRPDEDCRWQLLDLFQRAPEVGEALRLQFEFVNGGGLQIGPDRVLMRPR